MKKRVVVIVSHGIGVQKKDPPFDCKVATYSKPLRDLVYSECARAGLDIDIVWREAFWADVYQPQQDDYFRRLNSPLLLYWMHWFAIKKLADAGSYYPAFENSQAAYHKVHARIAQAVADVEFDNTDNDAIIFVGHSLGATVLSNFIYDTRKLTPYDTRWENLENFQGFLTVGANLPMFLFAHENLRPISAPQHPFYRKYWWRNLYADFDILGLPLRPIGGVFEQMCQTQDVLDQRISLGIPFVHFKGINAHNGYWTSRRIAREIIEMAK